MNVVSVMLVDRHAVFLDIARRLLEEYSPGDLVVVGTSQGGEDILEQARALEPHIMLIGLGFSDLIYLQIIPRLRTTLPHIKVIVLGLFETNDYRQAAMTAGADEFVFKIALNEDLVPAIRRVIAKE